MQIIEEMTYTKWMVKNNLIFDKINKNRKFNMDNVKN